NALFDLGRETEVERLHGADLHAKGLLVLGNPAAAHRALGRFAADLLFGDDVPGAGVDAVLAANALGLVDDHRAFFVLGDRFHGADRGAYRVLAVHEAAPAPHVGR